MFSIACLVQNNTSMDIMAAMKYCMFPSVIARIAREGINAVIKGAPIRQSI
ncbi:MAG: hypothetical protein HFG79_02925 [Lachnospiraceae bacterium]|nr:hypothetical protein [Lachnospiraceae bacterium]